MLKRCCAAVMAALVLAGCSVLPRVEPRAVDRYLLTLPAQPDTAADTDGPGVLVTRPQADAALDTQRMAYMAKPGVIRYFAHSQWADTPSTLLLPVLMAALDNRPGLGPVMTAPAPGPADLRLDTWLLRFHQDYTVTPAAAHVVLLAQVVDPRARRVLVTRRLEHRAAVAGEGPGAGAAALDRAAQALAEELAALVAAQRGGAP